MWLASCGDRTPVIEFESDKTAAVKENMINANRVVIQSEATQIEAYMQRRGWEMKTLPCGAQYLLQSRGDRATVIVPSEQAYGVVGDGDRVGSRTVIVYDIQEIAKRK